MSLMPQMAQGRPNEFQTNPVALQPLLPYLKKGWTIWECAAGDGNLARALQDDYLVIATDLYVGGMLTDFLSDKPPHFNAIVANPPFSLKDKFIARCYELGKPWAILLPINALGGQRRQNMYRKYGLQILMLGKRVMFKTPIKQQYLPAWQEHAWFTWGLSLPNDIVFARLEAK